MTYFSAILSITQAYTIYSVAKTTAGSGRDYLFDGATSTNSARSLIALRNAGKVQFWAGNWQTRILIHLRTFSPYQLCLTIPSQLSLNGTTVTGKNTGNYNLYKGINLGTNYNKKCDFLEGDIAELINVDGVASTSERQK